MKKNPFLFTIIFAISGCVTMDLQPGMTIKDVNSDFWVYCNKGDQNGPHILLQGNYEYDPSIQVYKGNPSTKRNKGEYLQCEKTLYFKDGVLVSDLRIKELNDKGEKSKRDLQERIQLKKQLMLEYISSNNLLVLDKFRNVDDDKFKIYVNRVNQRFYSINYEFVDDKFVATEIAKHEREEVERKERELIEKKQMAEWEIKRQNLVIEKEKQAKEKEENLRQFINKIERSRNLAKVDSVSEALNYSFGYPQDSSGTTFWFPSANKNGQCVYELIDYSKFSREPNPRNGRQIDLNKGDPKTIKVYKRKSPEIFGSSYGEIYSVTVEGIGSNFTSCFVHECDSDRLYRAWNLIYSKCAGKKTNF